MKKYLVLLIFQYFICTSQNFVGNNIEVLKNALVEFKEYDNLNEIKFRYRNIYQNFDTIKKQFALIDFKDHPFLIKNENGYFSDYNKIVGQQFIVKEIYNVDPVYTRGKEYYSLKIFNESLGMFYYKYNPVSSEDLEFKIINKEAELDYCESFSKEIDKFSNKKTYKSNSVNNISFVKIIDDKTSDVYLSIFVSGSTLNIGEKGVYLLFNNGSKIIKNEIEISVNFSNNAYQYHAFFKLKKNELNILRNNELVDFKLFIYDGSLNKESGYVLKQYARCLDKLN